MGDDSPFDLQQLSGADRPSPQTDWGRFKYTLRLGNYCPSLVTFSGKQRKGVAESCAAPLWPVRFADAACASLSAPWPYSAPIRTSPKRLVARKKGLPGGLRVSWPAINSHWCWRGAGRFGGVNDGRYPSRPAYVRPETGTLRVARAPSCRNSSALLRRDGFYNFRRASR